MAGAGAAATLSLTWGGSQGVRGPPCHRGNQLPLMTPCPDYGGQDPPLTAPSGRWPCQGFLFHHARNLKQHLSPLHCVLPASPLPRVVISGALSLTPSSPR